MFALKKNILLIMCIFTSIAFSGCVGINTGTKDFFGVKISGVEAIKNFTIESYNEKGKGEVLFECDRTKTDSNIFAFAEIVNWLGLFFIDIEVCNKSNTPISTNYFTDDFKLVTKDGKIYNLEKRDITFYPSVEAINPNSTVTYSLWKPDVKKEDIEMILCGLDWGKVTIALKPIPKPIDTEQDKAKTKK